MATRRNGQPTRRTNPADRDKIAADSYVKEVEELRKVLKDIKMKYRKAEAIKQKYVGRNIKKSDENTILKQ